VEEVSERKLPHNLEAEQSVLGALLVDFEAASGVFQILGADDFYSPKHRRIFAAIQDLYDRHSAVDEVMLHEELAHRGEVEATGGLEYLDELIDRLPAAANAEYYARIVRDKALLRSLHETCSEIVQGIYDSELPAQEQQDRAEQLITDLGRKGAGRDFVPIREVIDQEFQRLDDTTAGEGSVPSGFVDLDAMTTGFHPAQFIIVAGRPSMGKTSFCMNIVAQAAIAGKKVAIFSLEVSRDQLVQNLLCSFARVDAHRLRKRALSREDWQLLTAAAGQLRQTGVEIDDTPGLTPLALRAKARRLHNRRKLDLIVVDYLQLMESSASAESRQQEISTISRSLKGLAREIDVPLIAISQLSRGVESRENHKPRLSDLRESGAIEQDADLVLLLYRDEYYHPDREDSRGKAEVIVAKQRNGPTGSVELQFTSSFMRFESLAKRHELVDEAY
jgi:replicative DNA helicase